MPEPKSYARRLVKGSAIVFVALTITGLVGFVLRIFLARSLSVTEYGLFYAVFTLVSVFVIFHDLGLGSALVKYIPEFEVRRQFREIKSSMAFSLILQAVFAVSIATVIFAFSDQIALAVFNTGSASPIIKILGIMLFWMIFYYLFRAAFQGFQNMLAYALMNLFQILFVFLFAILFVGVLGFGIKGAAFAYLFATLAIAIFGLTLFWGGYPRVIKEKIRITKPLIKKLFLFALPVFVGGLGGLIISYTDTLMITVFRSLPEVGLYQTVQPTARILWYFVASLVAILFPMISELWVRRERKLLGNALHFLTKFAFILIIPAALVFIAFPGIAINLLFGSRYLAGAAALQILAGAAIVYTLYAILVSTMSGIGKPIINTKVVALMACLNLAGNLLLIPTYGIEGAAIATLSAYTLGFVLMFYYARKLIRFTVPASPLLKTLVGGVLTLLLIFGLKSTLVLPPWPEAFAVVIPSLAFYGIWILATKAVTKDDMVLIARIVPMPKWLVRAAGKFVGK